MVHFYGMPSSAVVCSQRTDQVQLHENERVWEESMERKLQADEQKPYSSGSKTAKLLPASR
jgi:hypothetical protein